MESVNPERLFLYGQKVGGKQGITPKATLQHSVQLQAEGWELLLPEPIPEPPNRGVGELPAVSWGVAGDRSLHCGTPALNTLVCRSTSKAGDEVLLGSWAQQCLQG